MLECKDMNNSDFNKYDFHLMALKGFPVTTSFLQQETMELPWSLFWGILVLLISEKGEAGGAHGTQGDTEVVPKP